MHVCRWLGLAVLGSALSGTALADKVNMPVRIEFAADQAGPFKPIFPTVDPGAKVWVRASWEGFTRPDQIRDAYLVRYWSPQDFGNALEGRQQMAGTLVYANRPDPYSLPRDTAAVTFAIDTGTRAAGTMGTRNKWDREKSAFVAGPLAACDALGGGEHPFTFAVYYYAPGQPDSGGYGEATFAITCTGPVALAPAVKQAARPAAAAASLPATPAGPPLDLTVAADGKDTNPGTSAQPLATLRKAAALATPGSTIHLRAGTYRESEVTLRAGGAGQQPLTIEGAKDGQTILRGSQSVTGWTLHEGKTWKVEGWKVNSQQLFADGKPLQQIGDQCRFHHEKLWAGHVALPPVGKDLGDLTDGSFFYAATNKTLYCILPNGGDPNGHRLEASVANFILNTGGQSNVVVRNLTFQHGNSTARGEQGGALLRITGCGARVEDCEVSYGDFAGISISGEAHAIRRCRVSNNGNSGIGMGNTDAAHGYHRYPDALRQNTVIEDCEISGNNYRKFYAAWHAGGLKLIPGIRAVTVRRCSVNDNQGPGIWFDGPIGENTIEDNLCLRDDIGIFYEIAAPVPAVPPCTFSALIRNNRVVHSRQQGIYVSASSGVVVEHNTVYDSWAGIVVHGMPREQYKLTDNIVRNNIVMGGSQPDVILFAGDNAAHNTLDGNFYVTGSAAKYGKNGIRVGIAKASGYGATDTTLESLRSKGYETNGLAGDPLWEDLGTGDFRLKAGSPAVGKGWMPRP